MMKVWLFSISLCFNASYAVYLVLEQKKDAVINKIIWNPQYPDLFACSASKKAKTQRFICDMNRNDPCVDLPSSSASIINDVLFSCDGNRLLLFDGLYDLSGKSIYKFENALKDKIAKIDCLVMSSVDPTVCYYYQSSGNITKLSDKKLKFKASVVGKYAKKIGIGMMDSATVCLWNDAKRCKLTYCAPHWFRSRFLYVRENGNFNVADYAWGCRRTLLVADYGGHIGGFEASTGRRVINKQLPCELSKAADCVKFSSDGARIAVAHKNKIDIFNVNRSKRIASIKVNQKNKIRDMAFNSDTTKLAVGYKDGTVQVWHINSAFPPLKLLAIATIAQHKINRMGLAPMLFKC